jgi:hypothetical protein
MLNLTLAAQAQIAYDAAINNPCPDWRAVAELCRAAMHAGRAKRATKPATASGDLPDYNMNRVKLLHRSPRIAVRFMDGEAVFTHVPSAPNKPFNIGRALRVAVIMYRYRMTVRRHGGLAQYGHTIPVPDIFQVRCLESDELFDVDACNRHTAAERASSEPEHAAATLAPFDMQVSTPA